MGEMRKACSTLVGKPERKRPFGRSRRRWENNIRIDLREYVGSVNMRTGFIWLAIVTSGVLY
jgi:hypothetical protein